MKKFKGKNLFLGTLAILVVALSFLVGSFWTKIQYLEKQTISQVASTPPVATEKTGSLSDFLAQITPKGTPDYGQKAGVSYDKVEEGLNILVDYDKSITLTGADKERYIKIGTSPETACEFCCGIGDEGFATEEGEIACGCSHNIAFSGLTKWLIANSNYSDEQIIDEIGKWKILFFPEPSARKEAQKRGISPESIGLPKQVGGC